MTDISLQNLKKSFGDTKVIHDLSIDIKDGELIVSDKGGNSSSFATTMIRTKKGEYYEWSATGRIGVSLAQLSSANDLAFSFRRAASRLVEMGGKEWGRQ